MLDKKLVEEKMKERGFTVYASMGNTKVHFISKHMYDMAYEEETPQRQRIPVINIIINLDTEEFQCIYNISQSTDKLDSGMCGSVMNDKHFNRIVAKFELEAKWMARLTQ